MLTIKQIARLYENGVNLVFRRKQPEPLQNGDWDPETLDAIVFLAVMKDKRERDVTILHEFIHARRDVLGFRGLNEAETERQAEMTYELKHYVLQFLKQLYGIK